MSSTEDLLVDVLTLREAAAELKVCERTLDRWRARGIIRWKIRQFLPSLRSVGVVRNSVCNDAKAMIMSQLGTASLRVSDEGRTRR